MQNSPKLMKFKFLRAKTNDLHKRPLSKLGYTLDTKLMHLHRQSQCCQMISFISYLFSLSYKKLVEKNLLNKVVKNFFRNLINVLRIDVFDEFITLVIAIWKLLYSLSIIVDIEVIFCK